MICWDNRKESAVNNIKDYAVFYKSIVDQDRASVVICNLDHEIKKLVDNLTIGSYTVKEYIKSRRKKVDGKG